MNAGEGYRATVTALFEAAVMVRCTGVYPSRAATGWAEFAQPGAAERLVGLLREAGRPARGEVYTAGNRHRYRIHRVVTDEQTFALLDDAWRRGYAEVCARPDRHVTVPHRMYVNELAAAAWRAALRSTGPVRATSPGLPLTDLDTATLLLRAARCIDMPVRLTTRPGGRYVLAAPTGSPRARLAELAAA